MVHAGHGLEGLNYFSLQAVAYNHNIPTFFFRGLKVDNNDVVPHKEVPLTAEIAMAGQITLTYKHSFSIDLTKLDYTRPQRIPVSLYAAWFRQKLKLYWSQ